MDHKPLIRELLHCIHAHPDSVKLTPQAIAEYESHLSFRSENHLDELESIFSIYNMKHNLPLSNPQVEVFKIYSAFKIGAKPIEKHKKDVIVYFIRKCITEMKIEIERTIVKTLISHVTKDSLEEYCPSYCFSGYNFNEAIYEKTSVGKQIIKKMAIKERDKLQKQTLLVPSQFYVSLPLLYFSAEDQEKPRIYYGKNDVDSEIKEREIDIEIKQFVSIYIPKDFILKICHSQPSSGVFFRTILYGNDI